MATAINVIVILIILFIFLTENIELRIISHGKITVLISSVLFTLQLSDVRNRKKKRHPPTKRSALSALNFILKRAKISVCDVALSKNLSQVTRCTFSALFSLLFAYSDSIADKISLPYETGSCDFPFAFDIKIETRLYVYILAFITLKIKNLGKARRKKRSVR